MNMFTGIIDVVRPVDVEGTASGSIEVSDRLVASTWALVGRGSDEEESLGAVTVCGMLLVGAACCRSVLNDGAKSASLNTAGLNGHSPQLENPDTALLIALALVYAAPKRAAISTFLQEFEATQYYGSTIL